jgi:hypothetical protein
MLRYGSRCPRCRRRGRGRASGRSSGRPRRRRRRRITSTREIRLQNRQIILIRRPARRLHTIDIIPPPGPCSPPLRPKPDIRIRLHVIQHPGHGTSTNAIRAAGKLPQKRFLGVSDEPGRRGLDALLPDCRGNACGGGS